MRFTRTILTASGLALAAVTAVMGVGEGPAHADPFPAGGQPPRPTTILAVNTSGPPAGTEVHEFDVEGADAGRVVAAVPEGDIIDVERAPDGTGYYAFVIGDTLEIRRIGSDEVVAEGWAPAVSPDGHRLAYAYYPDAPGPCGGDGLAVLDLATGDVRRFPSPNPEPGPDGCPDGDGIIDDISWAPDSRRLVYQTLEYMGGRYTPLLLDTTTAEALADAEPLDGRRRYSHPVWLADGRIVVAEAAADSEVRIMAVDPDTHQSRQFVTDAWHGETVWHMDADASGRHLLVSVEDADVTTRLLMLTQGAPPEELHQRDTYGIAVW